MTRSALDEYLAVVRPRYGAARKADKTTILDEFRLTAGMHRKASRADGAKSRAGLRLRS